MKNNTIVCGAFPIKAELSKVDKLHSTYLLGNFENGNVGNIYRYAPAEQLLNDINHKQLVFVSPELWEDPYEQRLITADFRTNYNYSQPPFACLCFTDDANEMAAAAWRMYSTRERNTLVRVYYDTDALLPILDAYCTNNDLTLIISKVCYGLTRNELRDDPVGSILDPRVKNKDQQFEDSHFFSLLSVKRKAFTFESEIRFFIVGDFKFDEKGLAPIGMDLRQVIQKVMVEPKDPKFLNKVERQNYEKLNNENDEFYKKKFHPLGIRTVRSTLYSEVPSNILIK